MLYESFLIKRNLGCWNYIYMEIYKPLWVVRSLIWGQLHFLSGMKQSDPKLVCLFNPSLTEWLNVFRKFCVLMFAPFPIFLNARIFNGYLFGKDYPTSCLNFDCIFSYHKFSTCIWFVISIIGCFLVLWPVTVTCVVCIHGFQFSFWSHVYFCHWLELDTSSWNLMNEISQDVKCKGSIKLILF